MREILKIIIFMEKGLISELIINLTKEIGLIIKCMEKEFLYGQMEEDMKALM